MNEAAMSLPQPDAISEGPVRISTRLLIYLAVWLLAALALEVFLQPLGLTETDATPLEQRLWWPLYTPLMVFLGLAMFLQVLPWPSGMAGGAALVALIYFAAQAYFALTPRRPAVVLGLSCLQALALSAGVLYWVRYSQLPTGG
jgi:hypothetical protein